MGDIGKPIKRREYIPMPDTTPVPERVPETEPAPVPERVPEPV